MNRKILLTLVAGVVCAGAIGQKNKQPSTAYAITGVEKGSHRWTEVRLVDINTGEEVQPIYQSSQDVPVLNARTGKPVKKQPALNAESNAIRVFHSGELQPLKAPEAISGSTTYRVRQDGEKPGIVIIRNNDKQEVTIIRSSDDKTIIRKKVIMLQNAVPLDQPFSTSSAACAFDKKHGRLYYTPMGINQLRYIDLKGGGSKVYYFEDEPFGALANRHDVPNQITRMVIASDGNGYALTNNGEHLIRFTTNRKAVITDLGSLKDDPANGEHSIHSRNGYGGDMIADDDKNLFLITANRNVFKISIDDLTATYVGTITGLPRGYTTNGAAVEEGTNVIVSSSNTTLGFYRFDIKTMVAEKVSAAETVYKISDLANGNLLSQKEEKKETKEEVARKENTLLEEKGELNVKYKMAAFPNPASKGGTVNLSFNDFPQGRYQVQLMDLNGKLISAENLNVGQRMQLHLLQLPKSLAQGTYLVKIVGDANKDKVLVTEQVVVQ